MNHRAGFACGALAAMALAGCTALAGGARLESAPATTSGKVAFHGLLPAQEDPGGSRVRYVFVIHGMGDTAPTYSDDLLAAIAGRYRHAAGEAYAPVTIDPAFKVSSEAFACTSDAPPCRYDHFGELKVDRYEGNGRRIVVFTYFWNDDLWKIQEPFLHADLESDSAAALNNSLKHNTIDRGFGDAAAYLGPAKQLVSAGVERAVCAMLRDAASGLANPPAPKPCAFSELTAADAQGFGKIDYSFVSFSLGSRMLFDVLSPQTGTTGDALARSGLAARTRSFFMLANQLPLLGLGDVTVTREPRTSATSDAPIVMPVSGATTTGPCSRSFFSAAGCLHGKGASTSDVAGFTPLAEGLEVVAFHQPEDLLGFRASGGLGSVDEVDSQIT